MPQRTNNFFYKTMVLEEFALLPQKEARLVACYIRLEYWACVLAFGVGIDVSSLGVWLGR